VATLFFSYSHVDEDVRDQLETHLAGLQRQGLISSWHDRRIAAGEDFGAAIDSHLDTADVILLKSMAGGSVGYRATPACQKGAKKARRSGGKTPLAQNDRANRASRNSPNFAVALNCGIGSSALNAEVNAFEELQIVRGRNSSYFGSKYKP
jgi:hypothetical protein